VWQSEMMSLPELATQHLQTIRTLMERAAIYRAISGPSALIGGGLSIIAAGGSILGSAHGWLTAVNLQLIWGGVLLTTLAAHAIFVWREARRERRPIWSPTFRLALRSALPFFILTGIWLVACRSIIPSSVPGAAVVGFCLLYGLMLLSTQSFAPRSVIVLGWSFFLAGCLMIPIFQHVSPWWFSTYAGASA
jgi:hypothetical protein